MLSFEGLDPTTTSTAKLFASVQKALSSSQSPTLKLDQLLIGNPPLSMHVADHVVLNQVPNLFDRTTLTAKITQPPPQAPASSRPTRRRQKSSASSSGEPKSTDDLGATLSLAHTKRGGNFNSAGARKFRRATREARRQHEEVVKANQRFAAAISGNYEISLESSGRLGRTAASDQVLKVTFTRNRTPFTEVFDVMPEDLIRAVITETVNTPHAGEDMLAHPRERLRPDQMALHSPMVFWNIVRLKGGHDLIQALQTLVPDVDFAWMLARVRRKSERARMAAATEALMARGAASRSIAESDDDHGAASAEPNDDLRTVFEALEDRDNLRQEGISSVASLANLVDDNGEPLDEAHWEDFVSLAREKLVATWMDEKVLMQDVAEFKDKLKQADIETPADIAKLRVPGRTEWLTQELQLPDRNKIDLWRQRADHLLVEYAWLSLYRTRG